MIKKMIRQMLAAQILSALTVSLCLLIDSIVIGQYLGEDALSAYGLANPILLIIGAFGTALSAGVQVVCSRALGRGSQEEANAGFSSAVFLGLVFSLPFMILVLLFCTPISRILGAHDGKLLFDTATYIRGFVIGAPATMGALILVPFLQMGGRTGLLIASVGTMTVADIVLDLLNVTVFHGGMFGMGLASALSYYAALLVGGTYFFSKKCFFRFSLKQVSAAKMKELFQNSIPAVFNMASSVILVYAMNHILLGVSGSGAVAAYSVISSIGNASCCISTGVGGVSLTLSGIFYNEEDRRGLRTLKKALLRASVLLGIAVAVIIILLAPQAVSLFITEEGPTREMAILGLRIFELALIPCCINGALKNAYQGTGRERWTEMMSLAQNAVCPVLSAWLLSSLFGTTGAWFFFLCGELLTFAGTCFFVWKKTGLTPWKELNLLMLPADFSAPASEILEVSIHTMQDVSDASLQAYEFCRARGQSAKISNRLSLCVEEMAANVVKHGFSSDAREHHLYVRLMNKKGRWILRFRDNCRAFDPVSYVPGEKAEKAIGIRLVLALADEIRYTYSMSLNNLVIVLNEASISSLGA